MTNQHRLLRDPVQVGPWPVYGKYVVEFAQKMKATLYQALTTITNLE